MLRIVVFYVLPIVLSIFCLVQAITSRDEDIRHLPKVAWILLILFFPFVGSIAWLAAGQPRAVGPRAGERAVPQFPEYDRPGRAAGISAESDEEFLKGVRERAEEQRRRYAEQKKREAEAAAAEEAARRARKQQRKESDGPSETPA